jgi:DNA-directed RNA polymerase subunit RPC12/RpoP
VTRVCVQCKELLGEKCKQCGAEAAPVDPNAHGHPPTGTEFRCPACSHCFSRGEGGETGGMCEACFDETLRKAHEQQQAGRQ